MKLILNYYFICSFVLILAAAQKDPNFLDNRTTIVHLFEWTWKDIARECEDFLGPQGYGGVQVIYCKFLKSYITYLYTNF